MPQCNKCGSDIKFIQAGVSKKTGKPYNAFYSCTNKDCGATAPASQAPANMPRPTAPNWDKINKVKTENIRWLNCLNNATLLVAHGIIQNGLNESAVDTVNQVARQLYNIEPPTEPFVS